MRWQRSSVARKTPGFGGALSCISEIQTSNLDDSTHVVQLQRVFREANRHRMAIVVHLALQHEADMGSRAGFAKGAGRLIPIPIAFVCDFGFLSVGYSNQLDKGETSMTEETCTGPKIHRIIIGRHGNFVVRPEDSSFVGATRSSGWHSAQKRISSPKKELFEGRVIDVADATDRTPRWQYPEQHFR